jgi:radical SAM superfamily enzyme YgiQ (UPF0313 family)
VNVPDVVLLACYELGHQPLSLAGPAAFLEEAGFSVVAYDLSVQSLPVGVLKEAKLAAISVPMHTALHLAVMVARQIRELNPEIHLSFYGLYAWLNADHLLAPSTGADLPLADSILAGEFETALVQLARRILLGERDLEMGDVLGRLDGTKSSLVRQEFPVPVRQRLPGLANYAHYQEGNRTVAAGYVEASRGCLHTCLHCPVVPVYGGRFFVVPAETVLADIDQQVGAGASHITFGDPDFLNGPGHVMRILRAMHEAHPQVTFDFTTKVEHILEKRHLLPELRQLGASFVISAFESTSDEVLRQLKKGHTVADLDEALTLLAAADLPVRPTWVPFTPWMTLDDYLAMLGWIRKRQLIANIPPVQLSIRLLIPPGSALLAESGTRQWLGRLAPDAFTYAWKHPDPRVDALQRRVHQIAQSANGNARQSFAEIEREAYRVAGAPAPKTSDPEPVDTPPPRLTEDWFC